MHFFSMPQIQQVMKKMLFPYTLLFFIVFCNFSTVKELVVVSRKNKYGKIKDKAKRIPAVL